MFWTKSKPLTNEEICSRGRVAALMTIAASADFLDNQTGKAVFWARSLAGVIDKGKLTEAEKDLAKELAYLGIVGLADGAKNFFNDNDSINIFSGSAGMVLKNSWPDHPATKRYFSQKINSRETLYGGVITSFVNAYKNKSSTPLEELKRQADQFLAEQMIGYGRACAKSILSMAKKEVDAIAKSLGG